MKTAAARALKVSVIVASLIVFAQLSAQAAPQVVSEDAGLDATGFFPGGWDRNDLRSDAAPETEAKPESETSLDSEVGSN